MMTRKTQNILLSPVYIGKASLAKTTANATVTRRSSTQWTYKIPYFIEYSAHFFCTENDAEIFLAHYTWKLAEKGFKVAFMMNELAMIISFEIIFEK
jgi:hypothetical protein